MAVAPEVGVDVGQDESCCARRRCAGPPSSLRPKPSCTSLVSRKIRFRG